MNGEQFTEPQRRIFPYTVAGQQLYADPLTVRRRLDFYLSRPLNDALAAAAGNDPALRFAAEEDLLSAARLAFDKPWNETTGQGATEEEMRAAVGALADFLYGFGSSGATMPPSCEPSAPSEPSPPPMTPTSGFSSM